MLWQGRNEGLLRGHEGNTPTTHSGNRYKEERKRAGLRWVEAQAVATENSSKLKQ